METEFSSQVRDAVENAGQITRVKTEFVASNGIKLKLKKVSRLIILDISKAIKDPPIPVVLNPDKGRAEPNPLDPDYKSALTEANVNRSMAVMAAVLALGSEVEVLPEGMDGPTEEGWLDFIRELGLELKTSRMRYVAWLKYYALTEEEIINLSQDIMALAGMTMEVDVVEAEQSFRGEERTRLPKKLRTTKAT